MSYVISCLLPKLLYILIMSGSLPFYNLKNREQQDEEEGTWKVEKLVDVRLNGRKKIDEFCIK